MAICLSDLEKRTEETQETELHQAVPPARVCDDYTMQPAAVADDDDHYTCINVKFPLTPFVSHRSLRYTVLASWPPSRAVQSIAVGL